MKCYICDKTLPSEEIIFDERTNEILPCRECMVVIRDSLEEINSLEDSKEELGLPTSPILDTQFDNQ